MLNKLFGPKKEDICPNCGTACFATDVLCPKCGKNLDELFEQLSDLEESRNLIKVVFDHLAFLNWLIPLLMILSPILLSSIVALSALRGFRLLLQDILQLVGNVVLPSAPLSTALISVSAIPLCLCTNPRIRARLGKSFVVILAFLLNIT